MKIVKLSGNDCGGFTGPKKGKHLDTQMFPECEGTETDRNIVTKTVKRRKKRSVSFNLKEYKIAKWGKEVKITNPGKWEGYSEEELRSKRDAARKRQDKRKEEGKAVDPKDTSLL